MDEKKPQLSGAVSAFAYRVLSTCGKVYARLIFKSIFLKLAGSQSCVKLHIPQHAVDNHQEAPHKMDLSIFNTVGAGLNKAYESAQALLKLKVETEAASRINDLALQLGDITGKFLQAQQAHMTCQERTMQLEQEVTRLKAFEAEKDRYAMQKIGEYSFAYALKPEAAGDEPPHYICANCYANSQKSILQRSKTTDSHNYTLTCPRCKSDFLVPHNIPLFIGSAPRD